MDPDRRLLLLAELALIFLAGPVLLTLAVYGLRIPLFLALPPVLVVIVTVLVRDATFALSKELAWSLPPRTLASILVLFLAVGSLIAASVAEALPHAFLAFPRSRPGIWLSVIVLYPLLSVLAQELVFRTFFFHRYGPLFGEQRWLAVITNGILFGYAHIMFYNPVAIVATTVSGTLFAWRYQQTRSFWAVVIEHTLYGWLIFTVGLGAFFFTGIANPRF